MKTIPPLGELLKADEAFLDACEGFLAIQDDFPSPAGLDPLLAELAGARRTAEAFQPADAFERDLQEHLLLGWRLNEILAGFRLDPRGTPIGAVVDALGGPGSVDRLLGSVADLDPAAVGRYLQLRQSYRRNRALSRDPKIDQQTRETADHLIAGVQAWLRQEGLADLPGTKALVSREIPADQRIRFRPAENAVFLGGAEFYAYRIEGSSHINPVAALRRLLHEWLGRSVQSALSRTLPAGLRPDHRPTVRLICLPATLGFAAWVADLSGECAAFCARELGFSATDLEFLDLLRLSPVVHHAVPAVIQLLAIRRLQEPGFDDVAYLADRVGHAAYSRLQLQAKTEPLGQLLHHAAAFCGHRTVRGTAACLQKRGLGKTVLIRALGRGAWSLPLFERAVCRQVGMAAAG